MSGIKRGERNVALVNIEKIATALRISLSELFRCLITSPQGNRGGDHYLGSLVHGFQEGLPPLILAVACR